MKITEAEWKEDERRVRAGEECVGEVWWCMGGWW